jgi:hypothetical protein
MNRFLFLIVTAALCGCHRNEFDVTPDQVRRQTPVMLKPRRNMFDFNHLPPGSVKHEKKFKKGETLPDGQIADHDMTIYKVEFPESKGPAGNGNNVVTGGDTSFGQTKK